MNPAENPPNENRIENEHDSSFSDNSFSSDDEFKRDAHYRPLYRQDSEENSTFDEESSDEDGDQVRANENGLYNHNVIVEWINTNEPLFDRAEYEARLRRIIDGPADPDDSDSDYDIPKENENSLPQTSSPTLSNTTTTNQSNSSPSTSKSDIPIGEDKSKTIMNIMSSFTIPTDNRPEWAKNISEQEWKQHLDNKITPENKQNSSSQ